MIPDYQSIMLPLLNAVSDGKEYPMNDLIDTLAAEFELSETERKELLPSGQQFTFGNRVGWARTYLKKAGLLDSPGRGLVMITERGKQVLGQNPDKIDVSFLRQYPEFLEFQNTKHTQFEIEGNISIDSIRTPEESLDSAYQGLREALANELLNRVISLPPSFFERLVVDLLVKMGYGGSFKDAGKAVGRTKDEGIDGTIKEDRLGLDIIYIQAKRWKQGQTVGRPEVQRFVGALAGQGAKKGIFITTSNFSKEAIEFTPKNETKIVLIDGQELAQLMIDHGIGVSTVSSYEIKKIDNDYFEEE
ncbi:MAG: restriction endonuclease [Candidatus Kryptoniota bacterium]